MFEKLHDYLSKQIKTAYHTIVKSLRLFIPLFFAVLLIECLLFTVLMSYKNNIKTRQTTIRDGYDYHVVVSGLDSIELSALTKADTRSDSFNISKKMAYESTHYDTSYTAYIKLLTGNKGYGILTPFINDSLKTNYDAMRYACPTVFGTEEEPNTSVSVTVSPLYTEKQAANDLRWQCAGMLVLLGLISALFFSFFFRVYINDKKFSYGLYSAFGAHSRDLIAEVMTELSLILLVLALPSYYLSSLICHLIFKLSGAHFFFHILSIPTLLIVIGATFLILLFSVSPPIIKLSLSSPMELLASEEDANSVVSPRSSFSLLEHRFPFGYELISLWRFRRHHFSLALASALLSILFVVGSFFSVTYSKNAAHRFETDPHFTMKFSDTDMISEEALSIVKRIKNLSDVHSVPQTASAADYASLLEVSERNVTSNNGLPYDKENKLYYTGDVKFISGAADTPDWIRSTYRTSGAFERFSEDTSNIIIGKTFQNSNAFSFEVGDTVTLAVAELDEEGKVIYKDENAKPISDHLSGRYFWEAAYKNFSYRYITLTVVGIIEDYPSGAEGIPIVMHPEAYERITGTSPTVNTIEIRMDNEAGDRDFTTAEGNLRDIAARFGHCTVTTHDAFFENRMEAKYCYAGVLRFVSASLLLFIPLIWIYAQLMFFRKREKEFYVLSAISAAPAEIRKLHFSGSVMMIPVAFVSLALSMLVCAIFFFFFERFLPNVLGISDLGGAATSLPFYVYLIGIFITLISCLLSAFFPYLSYRKKHREERFSGAFHDEA